MPVINELITKPAEQKIINIKMSRNAINLTIVLLSLVALSTANTYTFQTLMSSPKFRSSFQVGYGAVNSEIMVNVSPVEASNRYRILIWRPGQSFPADSPFSNTGPYIGFQSYTSALLDATGTWRVQILPEVQGALSLLFTVEFKVDGSSKGKYVGVASYTKIVEIYHKFPQNYGINLNLVGASTADIDLTLFGPFSGPSYNGGNGQVVPKTSSTTATLAYNARAGEYYYLVADVRNSNLFTTAGILFTLVYQSDQYECPYDNNSADYNGVFRGCSTNLPTKGYPCSDFDDNINKCLKCTPPWEASSNGVCLQTVKCPKGQYVTFGQCKDALRNCVEFDFFGGLCHACDKNYNLIVENNVQVCKFIPPTCAIGQYLLGVVCMKFVDNCANFKTQTGICENCKVGYDLKSNLCVVSQKAISQCPTIGMVKVNGVCQVVDQNCIFLHSSGFCQLCTQGYVMRGGRCEWLVCGPRQYNGEGTCLDVSLSCLQFDQVNGNCLTCKDPDLNSLQRDGNCRQTIPSQGGSVVQAEEQPTCQNGYFMRDGTCVQADPQCNGFDKNGRCAACRDTVKYILDNGACVSIQGYCASLPRTYFSNGKCIRVMETCDLFDTTNGHCIGCLDGTTFEVSTGRCLYNEICYPERKEFRRQDGSCGKIDEKCKTFTPDGLCMGCEAGLQINSGYCCPEFNYLSDPKCRQYHLRNCAKIVNNMCAECNSGYQKLKYPNTNEYQYYSKCRLIASP